MFNCSVSIMQNAGERLYKRTSHQGTAQNIILNSSCGAMFISLKDDTIIGRVGRTMPHNLIDLTRFNASQAGVSRQHVYMMRADDGKILIGDMHSLMGTYLNNERLVPHRLVPLNNGDVLQLGKMVFHVRFVKHKQLGKISSKSR